MGDRGPVEKDRELIKHSDPSFTIARAYGRQGREARRRTAVSPVWGEESSPKQLSEPSES